MKCKFCEWEKHYEKIFENKYAVAVWGSPYVKGHVKVIVKRHAENLTDLSHEEAAGIMDLWIRVGKAIQEVLHPDIINWQINGNWVRHVHGHIYPRWETDADWGKPLQLPADPHAAHTSEYDHNMLSHEVKTKISDLVFHNN